MAKTTVAHSAVQKYRARGADLASLMTLTGPGPEKAADRQLKARSTREAEAASALSQPTLFAARARFQTHGLVSESASRMVAGESRSEETS